MALVSILMPCFNSGRFVEEAVRSVQAQTFSDWELLVCDDNSNDNSLQILERLAAADDKISVLENNGPRGAPGARNTCLSEAKGRYIAFLDSDDIWLPQKLELQLRFMKETNAPFVFSYCENITEEGDLLSVIKAPKTVSFQKLLACNFIPCLTVIYDSKILGKVKQPNIKKRNDFALWLRILRENRDIKAWCYPEVIARYRVNNYGLSANKLTAIKYFYRCLRQFAGLGIIASVFYTFIAVTFKIVKTLSLQAYNLIVTKFL